MDQQKILIVQLGRIGDLVLMTPMFEAIKRDNERHEIQLLCGRRNTPFAATLPNIAKVHTYRKTLPALLRLLTQLRAEAFAWWIDPKDHYSGESALFARWVGAPCSIGFNREDRRRVFTHSVPDAHSPGRRHVIDHNLAVLAPLLGATDVLRRPHLTVDHESEARLTAFLAALGLEHYLLVNVSAGSTSRHWPVKHWIEVIEAFAETPVLINSAAEELPAVRQIVARCPNAHHFPTKSFLDVIALVRSAALMISPDTSLIHVASAFDTPTVGLYRKPESGHPAWTPLSQQHRIVVGGAEHSIADIGADEVILAVASIAPVGLPFFVPDG